MSFKQWMARLHYPPGNRLSPLLWPALPLSWAYGLAVSLRLLAYRMHWLPVYDPPVPVISVGNLTTGGTGKTPVIVEIAKGLIAAGKTVVILSRGYGAEKPVAYARALDPTHGDEAYMIQEQVPEAVVIVGRDRVATLKHVLRDYRPDYVLLDDGFQYLRLARALNILLVDGSRLLGNGQLLPVGPLREPRSEMQRANLVFLTKAVDQTGMATLERWLPPARTGARPRPAVVPVAFQAVGLRAYADFTSLHQHPQPFADFQHRPVVVFSGVAQPDALTDALVAGGLRLLQHFRFADHHVYRARDVQAILSPWRAHAAERPILITTDKDLPKVRGLLPEAVKASLYTLQMRPALDGRWFYDEFLTQMPGFAAAGKHAQSSGLSH